jgi:hypothetical protein
VAVAVVLVATLDKLVVLVVVVVTLLCLAVLVQQDKDLQVALDQE